MVGIQIPTVDSCLYAVLYYLSHLCMIYEPAQRKIATSMMQLVQWGSKIRTSLDFEWSKRGWVLNGLDFEWGLKSESQTI